METGMVVVDVSVPTGFTPVIESVINAAEGEKKIKRYGNSRQEGYLLYREYAAR